MNALRRAVIVASLAAVPLAAQQPAPSVAYEVASVKPNRSPTAVTRIQTAPGRYSWTAATLVSLINAAYQRHAFDQREIVGGPDWISTDRFDVVVQAQAGARLTDSDGFPGPVFAMVRAVLADRFGLVAHNEIRERPVYALRVARPDRRLGSGLTRVNTDCAAAMRELAVPNPSAARAPGPPPCSFGGGPGQLLGNTVSLAMFGNVLSRQVGRPVVDRTGITDYFDITLEFSGDARSANGPPQPPQAPAVGDGPSIFTALQEQLGLKLEAARANVDVLVIDKVSQPTEN